MSCGTLLLFVLHCEVRISDVVDLLEVEHLSRRSLPRVCWLVNLCAHGLVLCFTAALREYNTAWGDVSLFKASGISCYLV